MSRKRGKINSLCHKSFTIEVPAWPPAKPCSKSIRPPPSVTPPLVTQPPHKTKRGGQRLWRMLGFQRWSWLTLEKPSQKNFVFCPRLLSPLALSAASTHRFRHGSQGKSDFRTAPDGTFFTAIKHTLPLVCPCPAAPPPAAPRRRQVG